MGCSCRTFREEPFAASLLRKRSPHNNILRASPTREANLVRWREILRSSSCAPISLRRSMIPVSERICRCARVMSSCAVIGDTRAREWSEYRNLTTAHAMEPDGLAGDPQRELACDPYRELDSLRIADDNENEWLRLRSTGSKSCAGSSLRIAVCVVVLAARQSVPVVFPRREFAVAGRRPDRLSLAIAAGFIARCDLAVGGKRSKFRLHFRGAPLDARLRRVPRIAVVAAGWRNECERLRNPPSTYARGNFRRHVSRE